jgi:hypothetical protein
MVRAGLCPRPEHWAVGIHVQSIDFRILYANSSTVVPAGRRGDHFQGVGRAGRVASPGASDVLLASAGCPYRFLGTPPTRPAYDLRGKGGRRPFAFQGPGMSVVRRNNTTKRIQAVAGASLERLWGGLRQNTRLLETQETVRIGRSGVHEPANAGAGPRHAMAMTCSVCRLGAPR